MNVTPQTPERWLWATLEAELSAETFRHLRQRFEVQRKWYADQRAIARYERLLERIQRQHDHLVRVYGPDSKEVQAVNQRIKHINARLVLKKNRHDANHQRQPVGQGEGE
jgi:capsule polysaccharide export protein KpsE/RkpR